MVFEKEKTNEFSNIKKIIAIMSGKGGVGKSSVTSLLGVSLRKKGYDVGILDADMGGSSIPKIFGINNEKSNISSRGIDPVSTSTGIKVMSLGFLLDKSDSPVIWRGPLISRTIKQFYTDVVWGDLDYLLIDLPPGTGDVPLTIMQSLPVNGIIVVSSPQDLVKIIVKKSVDMAKKMNVPVLGIVENMSYYLCPDCRKKVNIFGESNAEKAAKEMGIELITQVPIDPKLAQLCDEGKIEIYDEMNHLLTDSFADKVTGKLEQL